MVQPSTFSLNPNREGLWIHVGAVLPDGNLGEVIAYQLDFQPSSSRINGLVARSNRSIFEGQCFAGLVIGDFSRNSFALNGGSIVAGYLDSRNLQPKIGGRN